MFIAHSYSQKLTQPKYTSNSNMDFKSIFGDFPGGSAGKKICLQCGRSGFDPWVGKILWRRERLPTPVFWPREFHGP